MDAAGMVGLAHVRSWRPRLSALGLLAIAVRGTDTRDGFAGRRRRAPPEDRPRRASHDHWQCPTPGYGVSRLATVRAGPGSLRRRSKDTAPCTPPSSTSSSRCSTTRAAGPSSHLPDPDPSLDPESASRRPVVAAPQRSARSTAGAGISAAVRRGLAPPDEPRRRRLGRLEHPGFGRSRSGSTRSARLARYWSRSAIWNRRSSSACRSGLGPGTDGARHRPAAGATHGRERRRRRDRRPAAGPAGRATRSSEAWRARP